MPTGPTTQRFRSSLAHGGYCTAPLIPGEDPDAYEQLCQDIDTQLQLRDGLEQELGGELASSVWDLKRTARAQRLMSEAGAGRYLEEGPPAPAMPENPHELVQIPKPDPHSFFSRYSLAVAEVGEIEHRIETGKELRRDFQLVLERDGLEEAARFLRSWRAAAEGSRTGRHAVGVDPTQVPAAEVLLGLPAATEDPEAYVDPFRRGMDSHLRKLRRQRREAERAAEAVRSDVMCLFVVGQGQVLDPRMPDTGPLERRRRRILKDIDRTLTTLAKCRALEGRTGEAEAPVRLVAGGGR